MDDPRLDAEERAGLNPVALPRGFDLEDPVEAVESLVVLLAVGRHPVVRWTAVLEEQ
jgi:hypothetical protein